MASPSRRTDIGGILASSEKDMMTCRMPLTFACTPHSSDPLAAITLSSWRVGGIALLFDCRNRLVGRRPKWSLAQRNLKWSLGVLVWYASRLSSCQRPQV